MYTIYIYICIYIGLGQDMVCSPFHGPFCPLGMREVLHTVLDWVEGSFVDS